MAKARVTLSLVPLRNVSLMKLKETEKNATMKLKMMPKMSPPVVSAFHLSITRITSQR